MNSLPTLETTSRNRFHDGKGLLEGRSSHGHHQSVSVEHEYQHHAKLYYQAWETDFLTPTNERFKFIAMVVLLKHPWWLSDWG